MEENVEKIIEVKKNTIEKSLIMAEKYVADSLGKFFRENWLVIVLLVIIIICAYGFELFNFNLSIDEEIPIYRAPSLYFVSMGEWGSYFVNRFILPDAIIPFVPLFLALVFQGISAFLLLSSWDSVSKIEKILFGGVMLIFPTNAYMYCFSMSSYQLGFGYLCTALSIFIFSKAPKFYKYLSILPAAFAIGIYLGFVPCLVSVFLMYIVFLWIKAKCINWRMLFEMSAVLILSVVVDYVIQRIVFFWLKAPVNGYIESYFSLGTIIPQFSTILKNLYAFLYSIYSGNPSVYADKIKVLPYIIILSILGSWYKILRSGLSILSKIILLVSIPVILFIPFSPGILLSGYIPLRSLLALPLVIAGVIVIALKDNRKVIQYVIVLFVIAGIFEFIVSNNHLFLSGNLALEADRLLASRIVDRIDQARETVQGPVAYFEVVGYLDPDYSGIIHNSEEFGASFFEWDEGSAYRIINFLQTIGFSGYNVADLDTRAEIVAFAESMPDWPASGSVGIYKDTVILKLSPYSDDQKAQICSSDKNRVIVPKGFCP